MMKVFREEGMALAASYPRCGCVADRLADLCTCSMLLRRMIWVGIAMISVQRLVSGI